MHLFYKALAYMSYKIFFLWSTQHGFSKNHQISWVNQNYSSEKIIGWHQKIGYRGVARKPDNTEFIFAFHEASFPF